MNVRMVLGILVFNKNRGFIFPSKKKNTKRSGSISELVDNGLLFEYF